jgi:hypothetical protein
VVLDDNINAAQYQGVLASVKDSGGAVAIEAERVLLGWVPQFSSAKVRQTPGVTGVFYSHVGRPASVTGNTAARAALGFFNDVVTGVVEDQVEAGLATPLPPLSGDVLPHPGLSTTPPTSSLGATIDAAEDSRRTASSQSVASLRANGVVPDAFRIAPNSYYNIDNTKSMKGRVTVQVFRMDSSGAIDPNTYSWTNADFTTAYNQVLNSFTWWANQASAYGITLSFQVNFRDPISRYTRTYAPTSTSYEPANRPSTDNYLWANDALNYVGYGVTAPTQPIVWNKVDDYCAARRNDFVAGNFDHSFAVFIVNNQGAASHTFTDGQRSFTYIGGPYTVLLSDNGGGGINSLGNVMTHEAGHDFWACDEYYDPAHGTCSTGCAYCQSAPEAPPNKRSPAADNANCSNCGVSLSCMMKDSSYTLCSHTPGQIGWIGVDLP